MKIFVTGGTGFIGTHLVNKLRERGHVVGVLESNLAETEKWQKEVRDFNPDAVAHLAWEGLPDYSNEQCDKNFNYSSDLFSFLKQEKHEKVLSVGSAWEYKGSAFDQKGESLIIIPPSADYFTQTKDRIHNLGKKIFDNFAWGRIFFVYGPKQRETSLIPYLINCAKRGDMPEIKNPFWVNDFIYIDDVVEALAIILEKNQGYDEYNIGSERLITNQSIINIVARKLGKNNWYKEENPANDNLKNWVLKNENLKQIGWEQKIDIEEGIQRVIDYYNQQ